MERGLLERLEKGWDQLGEPERRAGRKARDHGRCDADRGEPMIHRVRTRKKRGDAEVSIGTRIDDDSGVRTTERTSDHGPNGEGADSML